LILLVVPGIAAVIDDDDDAFEFLVAFFVFMS
jgi:hypothetical protein